MALLNRVRRKVYFDIEEHVPYVQAVGPYVQDRYGFTHMFVELKAPSTEALGVDRLIAIQSCGSALLESLPEEITQIQFSYATCGDFLAEIKEHASFESDDHPLLNYLRQDRARRLVDETHARTLVKPTVLMVLSCAPFDSILAKTAVSGGKGNRGLPERTITKEMTERADEILRLSHSIANDVLGGAGIKTDLWSSEEAANYLYKLFNPGLAQDIPVRYDYETTSFNDAWLAQNWDLMRDCWRIGAGKHEFFHGFVSLNQTPTETVPRVIEKLTTDAGIRDLRVVQNIRRIDKAAQAADMKFKLARSVKAMEESTNILDRVIDPNKKVDPALQQYSVENAGRADELRAAIAELQTGAEFQVTCQLIVHTWAPQKSKLDEQRARLLGKLSDLGSARGVVETVPTYFVFASSLPGSVEKMPRANQVRSRMAIDLAPISAGFLGGDEPVCVFKTPADGLVSLNLYSKRSVTAPMAFVSGVPGSGKSFFMVQLLIQHIIENALVMILDIGGSYRRLLSLLGGKVLEFKVHQPFCFNPLQVYGTDANGALHVPTASERSRIVACLEPLLVQPDDPDGMLPVEMANQLSAAVESVFRDASSSGEKIVTLSMLHKKFVTYSEHGPALASRITPFLKGQDYGAWFDGPTSVDLRDNLVVFDLQGIKKDERLCRAMTPIVINYIYDMVLRNKGRKKIVVMDEMWDLLGNANLVNFVEEAWKTFRKEDCATIGCSQSLGADIADSPVGDAIVANTQTWVLFSQGKAEQIERVKKLLDLNEGQVEALKNLKMKSSHDANGVMQNYRTALFIRGATTNTMESGPIKVEATPAEYWAGTTDPQEIRLFNETEVAFSNALWPAITFLADKYPHGIIAHQNSERDKSRRLVLK